MIYRNIRNNYIPTLCATQTKMKKQLLIILIGVILVSCGQNKKDEKSINKVNSQNESLETKTDSISKTDFETNNSDRIIERYFPEEKETTSYDTIVSDSNLKILITNSFLDSYVINEFESEGRKYVDKYRDSEKHLTIELSNVVIIDTILRKDDFSEYAGQDFLEIANFHGYWFNKIENDTIELFGVINKPETDWSFAFYHYLDLNSGKFKIKEHIDEEF